MLEPGVAAPPDARRVHWLLPGIPNLHSHAFQRAMAGLAERQTNPEDSFWTWRELMYGFAAKLTPELLRDIAAMLYVEMLESGYTSVCEFHYLHHAPDGRPYADPSAMSQALIEAATETGIGLTLLPTLYMTGGFDGRPLSERQRRFGHGVDAYLGLVERLRGQDSSRVRTGLCFHSLRAVPETAMRAVLEATRGQPMPIHIHIAEQIGEVQDCLALRNARPVEWLLDRMPVDFRWTLVHATHLLESEVQGVAKSGATVAICTTTEANLGDGLPPLAACLQAGIPLTLGSDSQVTREWREELRWLEYTQRLLVRQRNVCAKPPAEPSSAARLFEAMQAGSARAAGLADWGLRVGARADWLVLDPDAEGLEHVALERLLDALVFASRGPCFSEVGVAGRVVLEG